MAMLILAGVTNLTLINAAWKVSMVVFGILMVYEAWLCFLIYLNCYMWKWNGWAARKASSKEELRKIHQEGIKTE